MAEIENEEVEQQEVEQNPLASTGDAVWDKLIDDTAGLATGEKKNVNDPGKTTDGEQQDAPKGTLTLKKPGEQQETDDANKQRQEPVKDPGYQQTRSPARKFGNLFQSDAQGNIYDTNGSLIAKQGAQRAVFHRMYPQIEATTRELNGLRDTVKNYENANQIAKQEGLTLDEHGAALQMFVQWKKDPVKTMQTLLTLAEQSGRDITSIRQSSGPSLADIRANIREEIIEAIKPFSFLTENQKQQAEQSALQDEVATEYAAFTEEYPDHVPHIQAIANVMRDKNISHREAYFAVRAFAAERGLDWTKPLAEQLISQDQRRTPSGDGNNRRTVPPMGGRGRSEQSHVANGSRDQANATDSWDSIARRAMRQAGIDID